MLIIACEDVFNKKKKHLSQRIKLHSETLGYSITATSPTAEQRTDENLFIKADSGEDLHRKRLSISTAQLSYVVVG